MLLHGTVYKDVKESSRSGLAGFPSVKKLAEKLDLLDIMARSSGKVIFEAKSAFPYSFRPDKITICPNRITVTYGGAFLKSELPMLIDNVVSARVQSGLFFSSLEMDTFGIPRPDPVLHLSSMDARLARRYILALVECRKNKVDLNDYPIEELREKLKEIGKVYK